MVLSAASIVLIAHPNFLNRTGQTVLFCLTVIAKVDVEWIKLNGVKTETFFYDRTPSLTFTNFPWKVKVKVVLSLSEFIERWVKAATKVG